MTKRSQIAPAALISGLGVFALNALALAVLALILAPLAAILVTADILHHARKN